jgi:hypothetical protein
MDLRRIAQAGLLALLACNAAASDPTDASKDAGAGADVPSAAGCEESDNDGDGFGTHATCAVIDCDDANLGVHPGAFEACNGIDEDCDGDIDEELGEGFCGAGACRRSVPFCQDGKPVACTPAEGSAEACNGIDDDCDGAIDEELSGETCGIGACTAVATCSDGVWSACVPGAPSAESCNRIDDNCDNTIDEGFRATSVESSYTVMRSHHPGCDAGLERIGPSCNAAVHRFCASNGCTTSGFGPVENYMDAFHAGCVRSDGFDVPYAELATHHGVCDGAGERLGPNCNAAMHRWCASRGYASGFGPTEQGPDHALVQCVPSGVGTVIITSYTELSAQHGGCNVDSRIGPDCNAAIHRWCRSQGYTSGYGPVENSGDTAVVTCTTP